MTNEEKIREISHRTHFVMTYQGETPKNLKAILNSSLNELAEWKDQQFKEYLKKKRGYIYWDVTSLIDRNAKLDLLDEINNELFEETELDNSDREE